VARGKQERAGRWPHRPVRIIRSVEHQTRLPAHLSDKTGDADLATRSLQLARRYPELSPDEQTVVRHLVGVWVKDD
jgi:hypothetical protein